MATDVIMPKLGESITEATILEWKKSVGDAINRDETLLEISTDKVDSEVPSPDSGKIIEILYKVNDVVPVGEVIARIGSENEQIDSKESNEDKEENIEAPSNISNIEENIVETSTSINNIKELTTRFYSPLVKAMAKKEGVSLVDLDNLPGSGTNGRFNKDDMLRYLSNKSAQTKIELNESLNKVQSNKPQNIELNDDVVPMDHVRKMIANHMIKSRDTSVHVYSSSEVDMTAIVEYRNANKKKFNIRYQTPLTYTPFIISAVIKAIQGYPLINASILDENIKYNRNINMGVAVALEDNNLIVPVIKKSEEFNFLGIARSTADLAERARSGKLSPDEAQGSTFTVTNPGIFGSLFGMGIINQPNVAILSVGSIHKRPVVKETDYGDVVVIRSMMYLTLAYDHRIIDGAYGTKFLSEIKNNLENFDLNQIDLK